MSRPKTKSRLRPLLIANLVVYLLAAGLLAYFAYWSGDDPETTTTLSAAGLDLASSGGSLLKVMIPTPTAFPVSSASIFPVLTPVLGETLGAGGGPTPTIPAQPAVSDNALLPPSTINILLLGTDRRGNEVNWRTDTIMILSLNQEAKTAGLLSIPRDLWVKISGFGNDRINTADFYGDYFKYPGGGKELIKQTIERNLGIRVHYYIKVDMKVFRQAIDTLGGVDVDVDCPLVENGFVDDYGPANLNFQPGVQHMDGVTALRYARSRYTTSDFDRSRRQRKILFAAWTKARQLDLLSKWPALYSQFRSSVVTDLGPTELAALAWVGSQLRFDRIVSRAIDNRVITPWLGPSGEMVQLANPTKVHALLVDFFRPPAAPGAQAADEGASIQVLSGGASKQVADLAAVALRYQGLNVTSSEVSAQRVTATTLLVYRARPETVAKLTQFYSLQPANIRNVADPAPNIDLQVILGRDYNPCGK